jgi:hypothetical protein
VVEEEDSSGRGRGKGAEGQEEPDVYEGRSPNNPPGAASHSLTRTITARGAWSIPIGTIQAISASLFFFISLSPSCHLNLREQQPGFVLNPSTSTTTGRT